MNDQFITPGIFKTGSKVKEIKKGITLYVMNWLGWIVSGYEKKYSVGLRLHFKGIRSHGNAQQKFYQVRPNQTCRILG